MSEQERLEPLDESWERALAVVAHPDDVEYGTASAVARWTANGKQVVYLMVTRGQAGIDSMRPEEAGRLRAEEERNGARMICFNGSPQPTHAVDVTGYLERGIASLRLQKVYLENLGGSTFDAAAFLRQSAEQVGQRLGVQYAVAFEVYHL